MVIVHSYRRNKSTATATILLVLGLIVVLGVSFCLHATLVQVKPDVKVCVRNVSAGCYNYSCEKQNSGGYAEVSPPHPHFGYAGNFVHRDGNMAKPLPESKYKYVQGFID